MRLHTLVRSPKDIGSKQTYKLIEKACEELQVELVPLVLSQMKFGPDNYDEVEPGQGWLRLATGSDALLAENLLINNDTITVYDKWRQKLLGGEWSDTALMFKTRLPIIPTVFLIGATDDSSIQSSVDKLGGYPVVLKTTGLSHGRGVMLCQSLDEVKRRLEAVRKEELHMVAIRKFISNAQHVRAVVIDENCAETILYDPQPGDFRTNSVAVPTAKEFAASEAIKQLAVSAAQACGTRFAGIDILINEQGAYVAEVNTPFNFARNYLTTGNNLAVQTVAMIKRDIDKARQ